MTKEEVAAALEEIGTLLQLKGENDFRVRAYTGGARLVSQLDGDLKQMVADGTLASVRGIGDTLREKITTLVTTGLLPFLEELRASVPAGLLELLRLPGVGPKKVKAMYDELGIDSVAKLKVACEAGQVAKLKGFGEKTQQKMLEGIAFLDTVGHRVRIDQARFVANSLLERVKALPGVIRAEVCGSIRRGRETSKDIDILVSSKSAGPIMDAFVAFPEVIQVTGHGPTKSSVIAQLPVHGHAVTLNADLRVVTDEQFPIALVHFTGSKDHNIRLRKRAIERGWSLNEYALGSEDELVICKTEADVYEELGLIWVPPEMREDTGEIEASEKKQLPKLVEYTDIRGVFHNHTTASDGTATLEQMVKQCQKLGWEYFGIGDHSQSLNVANGLTPDRVRQQWDEIDKLNKKIKGFRVFKGTECDILIDGSLDYDDELLAGFDYVVVSVHTHFALTEEKQTERICKALEHPATTMLGHATGRLLLRREGYKLDLDQVIRTAAKHDKMIEINAQPSRLDLDWTYVKRAKELGVKLVINPDAHSVGELELTEYGVSVARRGWLTKADVFNTLSMKDVAAELKKRKQGP
jgi:DNA polymerase (family 10)